MLSFYYSAMNAGKSTMLLASAHNYMERGMKVKLLTSKIDSRAGVGIIASRIGIQKEAYPFDSDVDLYELLTEDKKNNDFSHIFVDEAQFLTEAQVWQLAFFSDDNEIPVSCYGLRTDFRGNLFEGSAILLGISDDSCPVKTICHCGKKAIMTARNDNGKVSTEGSQVQIGGNDMYTSLCRKHWREATNKQLND